MAAPDVLMVALGGISTGIVLKDRVYRLTRSGHPLSVNLMGEQVVLVGREYERVYNATTWKLLWNRPTKNEAVAFDTKRGWIFTAHQTKIRAWRASKPEDQVPFEKTKGSVVALSIDGLSRRLYAADPANLHSWKIGE